MLPNERAKNIQLFHPLKIAPLKIFKIFTPLHDIYFSETQEMSNLFLNDIAQSNKKGKLHLTRNAEIKVSE